jgi:hypothetical protein
MNVTILLMWATRFRPSAWSAARCPHCASFEAARIEDAIRVFSIWFIPITKDPIGKVARCDLCERFLEGLAAPGTIPLASWSPSDGLPILFDKLGVDPRGAPASSQETRLNSLIQSTEEATSINKLDISFGLTTGLIVGIALGVVLGIAFYEWQILPVRDQTRAAMLGTLLGAVIGAVCGAVISVGFKRKRVAMEKLRSASTKYRLDLSQLETLAQRYSPRVRSAAKALRDDPRLSA